MAVRFKNDAEFQQFIDKYGGRMTVTGGSPIDATTMRRPPIISPQMWKVLGWILWWFIGFVFGALTK